MRERIRVAFVIDVLDTDMAGTENQLIKMINGLDKSLFEVHLVCFRHHPWFAANRGRLDCSAEVIEISRFRSLRTYANILRLVAHFRALRPHVVHTFFPVANIVGVLAARLAGVRHIVSSRRDYGEWMTGWYLQATRVANRFVRKIVTNASSLKDLTVEAEKVAGDKVEVFHNGLDLAPFQGMRRDWALKEGLGIPRDDRVVGIVANFRPMKRHETFVKAAQEVLKARQDVHFILIGGTGCRRANTERLAAELGIQDRLHFLGLQHDVVPYLSIMDVGVNCSEREGLSNAIMEYMAAGVPSVVTDRGGNPDLITHDLTGLTFALDDHRALAGHILALLSDEPLRARLIAGAREKVARELTVPVMLNRYETFYRQLTAGG